MTTSTTTERELCERCFAGLSETDFSVGFCTQCRTQLRGDKMTKDKLEIELDAANRGYQMAMSRRDYVEAGKQAKRVTQLLRQRNKRTPTDNHTKE